MRSTADLHGLQQRGHPGWFLIWHLAKQLHPLVECTKKNCYSTCNSRRAVWRFVLMMGLLKLAGASGWFEGGTARPLWAKWLKTIIDYFSIKSVPKSTWLILILITISNRLHFENPLRMWSPMPKSLSIDWLYQYTQLRAEKIHGFVWHCIKTQVRLFSFKCAKCVGFFFSMNLTLLFVLPGGHAVPNDTSTSSKLLVAWIP